RLAAAACVVAIGWVIACAPVVVLDPRTLVVAESFAAGAVLLLAVASTAVGSTVTDREPLAFGIGTLVLGTTPVLLLVLSGFLGITVGRVIAGAPVVFLGSLVIGIVGFGSAVMTSWRTRLPLRDRALARAVIVRCAGTWAIGQFLCGAATWHAGAPDQ